VDDDSLYYSVNLNISGLVTIHIIGDTLNINTIENQFGGPVIATVTATDQMSSTPVSDNLEITVIGVNDPPVLLAIDEQEMDEDGIFIYSLNGTDPDGDQLSFSAQMDYTIGSLSIDGNLLKIIPITNYNGNLQVTASVSDGEYVDSTDFTLTVNAVNDAPIVLQPLADISLLEDSGAATMVFSSYFGDMDGDTLFYNVDLNINDIITAEISGETLIINTLQNQFGGPVIAMITASDQSGGTPASDNFEIMITGVNDPPILSQIDDQTINEDSHLVYSLSANDVDGDNLIYDGQISGNGIINITGNILSVTPNPDYYGDIDITISVSDDEYTDS
ncbi:uncharacterized protein METZ01_LOCUS336024, partial [marine metagenome]